MKLETFEDVQKLAEDILGYCKEELKKTPQLKQDLYKFW